jgi:alpha-amylase
MDMRSTLPFRLVLVVLAAAATLSACGGDDPVRPPGGGGIPQGRPFLDPAYRPSGRAAAGAVFVHLFEWKWPDVAAECENVLGPAGVRAVQVSPPQEHARIQSFPWWQRYQPVSYQLEGRSGTSAEFADMVSRCAEAGVGVYVDAVINHMTAGDGVGSAGTAYTKYSYPGLWDASDFHPGCGVSDYQSAANVQDCELLGLADLNTGRAEVRQRLAEYLIGLVDLGVAGFRIDAAKHIQPVELDSIVDLVNEAALAHGHAAPYFFGEVIDYGGEAVRIRDYFGLGYSSGGSADLTEFRFRGVRDAFTGSNGQSLSSLGSFSPVAWGLIPSDKAVVFIENHDTQRDGGALTAARGAAYRFAHLWLLAQPYGYPKIMSSYAFAFRDQGPPASGTGETLDVLCPADPEEVNPGEWVCEHRDPGILAMVGFRQATAGTTVEGWWDNGGDAIAFSRGGRGFVVLNLEASAVSVNVQSGLPEGRYCDILEGGVAAGGCSGGEITVAADGGIQIEVAARTAVAIHVGARP